MKPLLLRVGRRIQALRRLKCWNQSELARRAGLSQGHISAVENHGIIKSLESFAAILEAFQVPLDRFLRGIHDVGGPIKRKVKK